MINCSSTTTTVLLTVLCNVATVHVQLHMHLLHSITGATKGASITWASCVQMANRSLRLASCKHDKG